MELPAKPLGKQRKQIIVSLSAIGLWTFFLPMVILEPPVYAKTNWSPLDIAVNFYNRKLPVPGGMFDEGVAEIGMIYLLTIFALVAVFIPGPPNVLRVISSIGFGLSSLAKWWNSTFHWTFGYYGHMLTWHMTRGLAWWVVPWIMPAILIVSFMETLDW
jgi:hypothetical protein